MNGDQNNEKMNVMVGSTMPQIPQPEKEEESVCSTCLGTKKVAKDQDDGEGHTMRGVDEEDCPDCVGIKEEEEYNDQD